jgi:putative ABC transport system permease protein
LGEHFARRRSLDPGDTFEAVGVRVYVAGIISSPLKQDNNVAYVHLPLLQQSTNLGLGTVTQFNVRVDNHNDIETIANRIDEIFKSDSAPTNTRPEKAFFAQTAKDMIEMIEFTQWIGFGSVFAVLGLVANSLLLAARGRIRESAILQTIGFSRTHVALIMVFEGFLLGLWGGLLGCCSATLFFYLQSYTLGNEGLTLALLPSLPVMTYGLFIAMSLGLIASIWPAIIAAKRPLTESLRN